MPGLIPADCGSTHSVVLTAPGTARLGTSAVRALRDSHRLSCTQHVHPRRSRSTAWL